MRSVCIGSVFEFPFAHVTLSRSNNVTISIQLRVAWLCRTCQSPRTHVRITVVPPESRGRGWVINDVTVVCKGRWAGRKGCELRLKEGPFSKVFIMHNGVFSHIDVVNFATCSAAIDISCYLQTALRIKGPNSEALTDELHEGVG